MKPVSYWWTTRDYTPSPPLDGSKDVDVVIIGGGFSGLSTAYHLKKMDPSLSVLVLEGEAVGFGASGRNAGFGMTLFGLNMQMTKLRFGADKAREAHVYMEDAVDHLWEMIQSQNLDCEAERTGFLRAATSSSYARRIQHEIRLAQKLGLEGIEWLGAKQVQDRIHCEHFLGAWWEPRCVLLNPVKLAWELKRIAQDLGVMIAENTAALSVQKTNSGYTVKTPYGNVRASKIAFATNAFSSAIKQLKSLQVPLYTYIVLTEPLGDALGELGWRGREGIEDARNFIHYFRLTSDNRLLMGGGNIKLSFGSKVRSDFDVHEKAFAHLQQFIGQLFPHLKSFPISHRWGGPVSATLDLAPVMGYLGSGKDAVYTLGCMGHGVSMSQYNGRTLAELLLEQTSERTKFFAVNRFAIPWPPEPLRIGLGLAMSGMFKLEDRWTVSPTLREKGPGTFFPPWTLGQVYFGPIDWVYAHVRIPFREFLLEGFMFNKWSFN